MSAGHAVYTDPLRFKLVEKTSSEVGDGKPHCMLATREQLAEVMYRVKDAQWVSGSAEQIQVNIDDEPVFSSVVTFTSASRPTAKVEWELQSGAEDAAYTRRAYVTVSNDATPDMPMDAYGTSLFSEATYLTVGGVFGGSTHDLAFREAVSEYAMWANAFPLDDANQAGHYEVGEIIDDTYLEVPDDQFRTGFSFVGESWTGLYPWATPAIYAPYSTFEDLMGGSPNPYLGGSVELIISGEVAWVDDNGSGNPFDPLNRLYIGVTFIIRNSFHGTTGVIAFCTDTSLLTAPAASSSALLKLKLSGDEQYITAPIYVDQDGLESPEYYYEAGSVTDWIFEATDWWPQAKNSPATAVWNSATGIKIP